MPVFSAATGWLLFAGLVLCAGTLSTRFLVLPREDAPDTVPTSYLARLGRAGALVVSVALLLVFVRQLVEFRDPFAPLSEDVSLLLGSAWGTAWLRAIVAAAAATTGFWMAEGYRRGGWLLAGVSLLGLAFFPGITGHAGGEQPPLRWLAVGADALHVLAAGSWVGGLTVVMLVDRRARRQLGASLLPLLVPRFSPVAMASVAILVLTGVLASWLHLASVRAAWETPYGRLLSAKVALVVLTLLLGAVNWRRFTPRLTDPGGPDAMRRAALAELAVGSLVLLVTAVLVRTSPMVL